MPSRHETESLAVPGLAERPAIIAHSGAARDWQPQASALITSSAELLQILGLDPALLPAAEAAALSFPLKVPRSYVARMQPGRLDDPLLRQVLGQAPELDHAEGFSADPLQESVFAPVPGILHKYHGRVLLLTTGACAIHCRYCFRRHFPYQEHVPDRQRLLQAMDWLRERDDIDEVILSGGDPLSLSDRRLRGLLDELSALPHVKRLRIHTRLPVVMPERVSAALLEMLSGLRLPLALVLHANHANELGGEVEGVLRQLRATGATLLNQAVLLRGINDSAEAQCDLAARSYHLGVLPYYLHQLDRVAGAAHFAVSDGEALAVLAQMQARLPGYLVPKLVREQAHNNSKTWLQPPRGGTDG